MKEKKKKKKKENEGWIDAMLVSGSVWRFGIVLGTHTTCCHSTSRPVEVTKAMTKWWFVQHSHLPVSFLSCLCHLLGLAVPSIIPRHFGSDPLPPSQCIYDRQVSPFLRGMRSLPWPPPPPKLCAVHAGRQMVGGQEDKPICDAFPLMFRSLNRFAVITNTFERTPRSLEL